MTLENYGELETTIGQYLDRSDRVTQIQDWVRLVEFEVGRKLNLRAQQDIATGTLLAGSDTLETPVGILYPRQLVFAGSPPINVDTVTIPQGQETAYSEAGRASPLQATVWGVTSDFKTQIRVWPAPSGDIAYTLYYTTGITPLTAANPTNYLLRVAADLYLFGCLYHGHLYDENPEGAATWRPLFDEQIRQVKRIEWKARIPGRVHVRPRHATP